MGQVSAVLRKVEGGHGHWCPGCKEMHVIPDSWTFDGNVERPSFNPSVKISGHKLTRDAAGEWDGGWERDAAGALIPTVCHYFVRVGRLEFCFDCTHEFNGQSIDMPALPSRLTDTDKPGAADL